MKDLKYLLAFVPILAVYLGFSIGGIWTYSGFFVAFVMIPLLEFFLPGTTENRTDIENMKSLQLRFFDILLYLNIPLLYGLIFYFGWLMTNEIFATYEVVGMVLSLGIMIGTCGINVAHELGHRTTKYEQVFSKTLLLPAMYMHFFIEHNLGHHKNVATEKDGATSRFGENIYAFFVRSVSQSYLSAWRIENTRLKRADKKVLSLKNSMIRFQIVQIIYLSIIALIFNFQIMILIVFAAIVGFLLLETVNYIEHYGLQRKKLASGRYEPVQPQHSWNSNYEVGRIVLYELTRHSDHHFKSTRKYQTLRHFEEAPQLPFGYPMSMLIALVPPVWFRVMDEKVPA
jgi:alkane 1-monooxygenase